MAATEAQRVTFRITKNCYYSHIKTTEIKDVGLDPSHTEGERVKYLQPLQ
jgi:hypothetical protein